MSDNPQQPQQEQQKPQQQQQQQQQSSKVTKDESEIDFILEEDDDFEEFPSEDWNEKICSDPEFTIWDDNWEDDNTNDDFSNQLKGLLMEHKFQ